MAEAAVRPWDRQPSESTQAWEAFRTYRDMGPDRTVVKAYQQVTRKYDAKQASGTWNGWVKSWHWHARVEAWDRHRDREHQKGQLRAAREMSERHASVAMLFLQKAVERLRAMDPSELKPADVVRFAELAVNVERVARGEVVSRIGHVVEGESAGPNVTQLTPEMARLALQLRRELDQAGGTVEAADGLVAD